MDVGLEGHIFGLPCEKKRAHWWLLPVPWGVTASFREGTEAAPAAILEASAQVDTAVVGVEAPWKLGVYMLPIAQRWQQAHTRLRPQVRNYLQALAQAADRAPYQALIAEANEQTEALRLWIQAEVQKILAAHKRPALLGGEHSITQGCVEALLEHYPQLGLLQIDAHMDLRPNYTGLRHSHASVMYNLLEKSPLSALVQVGIQEFSAQEQAYATTQGTRVRTFYADDLQQKRFMGHSWHEIVSKIVATLPQQIYISVDIDGLAPMYGPHTGTPAAGGLSFAELVYLLRKIAEAGKQILGFDLVEVVPSATGLDQILAAQLLYRLFAYAGLSEGLLKAAPA